MQIRIQKILAQAGIASRRKSEELIFERRVKVNGRTARLGEKADPEKDSVTVDGKKIGIERKTYILLNKPKDYVTTTAKHYGEKNILELIRVKQRVFPVGRLDKDTEGLILLTNDGELANKLMHPRYETEKEYRVHVDKELREKELKKISDGIEIEGRKVKCKVEKIGKREANVRIHEGRKHIVKKIFEKMGYTVTKLTRIKLGILELDIEVGKWRYLSEEEIMRLKKEKN